MNPAGENRERHSLRVNGAECRVAAAPDTPLLLVLRNDLGLTSPKYGCGAEQCGACMVLIDGQPAPTCRLPVRAAAGRAIVTVEGLAPGADLHPIQEAFIAHNAIQCGYCVGGVMIAAPPCWNANHPRPGSRSRPRSTATSAVAAPTTG